MSERVLPFDAVENFRDYGDYASARGFRIAPRRLLRSGHQARATEADLERLSALNLEVVVDLRRRSEREAQPNRRPEGFQGRILESEDAECGEAPHVAFLKSADLGEANVRRFMIDTYRELAFDPRHVELFSRYFEALATAEGAVLIHCAAGKDRTGLLAALTHALLGVHPDDLMADYLLTNAVANIEARTPEIGARLEQAYHCKATLAAMRAFLAVEPEYLDVAFDEIEARYGSTERYLAEALGVGPERRAAIERKLLA